MDVNQVNEALSRLRMDLNFFDDSGIRLGVIHEEAKVVFSGIGAPLEITDESQALIQGSENNAHMLRVAKAIVFLERAESQISNAVSLVQWEAAAKAMAANTGSLNRLSAFLMSGIRSVYGTRVDAGRFYVDSIKDALTFAIDDLIGTLGTVPNSDSADYIADPLETFYARMKANRHTDKDIAIAYLDSRNPIEKNKLLNKKNKRTGEFGRDEAIRALIRRCEGMR